MRCMFVFYKLINFYSCFKLSKYYEIVIVTILTYKEIKKKVIFCFLILLVPYHLVFEKKNQKFKAITNFFKC